MADNSVKIQFEAGIAQLRKAFETQQKLQQKSWKTRKGQLKEEKKFQRTEQKTFKTQEKQKEQSYRKEEQRTRRKRDEFGRFTRQQDQADGKQQRKQDRARRKEKDHVKSVNQELKKGPLGRAGRFVKRAGAFAVGGLIGMAVGGALKGYGNANAVQRARGENIGLGSRSRVGGSGLGFNGMEREQMAGMQARATGSQSAIAMMRARRSTGMSAGEVSGIFGAMRSGGTKFEGPATVMDESGKVRTEQRQGQGQKQFSKIIAAGMFSGLEKARLPEFFKGITGLMQAQGARAAGDVTGINQAALAARLGRSGGAGFQGTRGMAIMQKIDQGIAGAQGGENQALMMRAFGYGKPGGGASWYQARKQQQKGLGAENQDNFQAVMDQIMAEFGTGQDAAVRTEQAFGTSLEISEQLLKIAQSSESSDDKQKKIKEVMEESKSLEVQAQEAMKKAGTNLAHVAGLFDQSVKNGEAIRKEMENLEKLQMQMVSALIELLPTIRDGINIMVGVMKEIWTWLKQKFGMPGASETVLGAGDQHAQFKARAKELTLLRKQYAGSKDPKQRERLAHKMVAESRALEGVAIAGGDRWGSKKSTMKIAGRNSQIYPAFAQIASTGTLSSGEEEKYISRGLSLYNENKAAGMDHVEALARAKKTIRANMGREQAIKATESKRKTAAADAARKNKLSIYAAESSASRAETSTSTDTKADVKVIPIAIPASPQDAPPAGQSVPTGRQASGGPATSN